MIILKQNDDGIGIKATLNNDNGPVDLTGSDAYLIIGRHTIPCIILDQAEEKGKVLITFEREHTAIPGTYKVEVEVHFLDGRVETFPNEGYEIVVIQSDMGGI